MMTTVLHVLKRSAIYLEFHSIVGETAIFLAGTSLFWTPWEGLRCPDRKGLISRGNVLIHKLWDIAIQMVLIQRYPHFEGGREWGSYN